MLPNSLSLIVFAPLAVALLMLFIPKTQEKLLWIDRKSVV